MQMPSDKKQSDASIIDLSQTISESSRNDDRIQAHGKLPPLNPESLALSPADSSKKDVFADSSEPISFKEVYAEIKQKLHDVIMGSTVSSVLSSMHIINLIVASIMIALCITQIVHSSSVFTGMSSALSVLYTIFFALLLAAYEVRTETIDQIIRREFGFMYHPYGRCMFLIMISIFPFGMQGVYGILVSLSGFANAYFNYYVITKHPSFTRGVPDYKPPSVP